MVKYAFVFTLCDDNNIIIKILACVTDCDCCENYIVLITDSNKMKQNNQATITHKRNLKR